MQIFPFFNSSSQCSRCPACDNYVGASTAGSSPLCYLIFNKISDGLPCCDGTGSFAHRRDARPRPYTRRPSVPALAQQGWAACFSLRAVAWVLSLRTGRMRRHVARKGWARMTPSVDCTAASESTMGWRTERHRERGVNAPAQGDVKRAGQVNGQRNAKRRSRKGSLRMRRFFSQTLRASAKRHPKKAPAAPKNKQTPNNGTQRFG